MLLVERPSARAYSRCGTIAFDSFSRCFRALYQNSRPSSCVRPLVPSLLSRAKSRSDEQLRKHCTTLHDCTSQARTHLARRAWRESSISARVCIPGSTDHARFMQDPEQTDKHPIRLLPQLRGSRPADAYFEPALRLPRRFELHHCASFASKPKSSHTGRQPQVHTYPSNVAVANSVTAYI